MFLHTQSTNRTALSDQLPSTRRQIRKAGHQIWMIQRDLVAETRAVSEPTVSPGAPATEVEEPETQASQSISQLGTLLNSARDLGLSQRWMA